MNWARGFLRSERGQAAPEYALLLAIIGGAVAVSAMALGSSISGALNDSAQLFASADPSDGSPAAASGADDGSGASAGGGGSPGASGNAPGQTGDTPGQSGSTPGQSGAAAPGQSGNTPGQSGSAPGKKK